MKNDKKRTMILLLLLVGMGAFILFPSGEDETQTQKSTGLLDVFDSLLHGETDAKKAQIAQLDKKIASQKKANKESSDIGNQLATWNRYSLPSDPQIAPLKYQSWLNELLYDCGITGAVKAGAAKREANYHLTEYTVQGRAAYIDWINFFDIFYRQMLLHRIMSLSITPIRQQDMVDVTIKIQTIALTGASRDQLPDFQTNARLASANPQDYMVILDRNIFNESVQDDPMNYATLTSIGAVNGIPEARFLVNMPVMGMDAGNMIAGNTTRQEVIRVQPGQMLRIGRFEGKLIAVYDDDIILESAPVSELGENMVDNTITQIAESESKKLELTESDHKNSTSSDEENAGASDSKTSQATNTTVDTMSDDATDKKSDQVKPPTEGDATPKPPAERWLLAVGERLVDAFALPQIE